MVAAYHYVMTELLEIEYLFFQSTFSYLQCDNFQTCDHIYISVIPALVIKPSFQHPWRLWVNLHSRISHSSDHIYMLVVEHHPPEVPCRIMAVFVSAFMLAQNFVVSFISVNSFYMVVMEKRFNLGKYDLWLLIPAFGVPLMLSLVFAILKMLGPSGGW